MATLRDRFAQAWKAIDALDSVPDDRLSDFTANLLEAEQVSDQGIGSFRRGLDTQETTRSF